MPNLKRPQVSSIGFGLGQTLNGLSIQNTSHANIGKAQIQGICRTIQERLIKVKGIHRFRIKGIVGGTLRMGQVHLAFGGIVGQGRRCLFAARRILGMRIDDQEGTIFLHLIGIVLSGLPNIGFIAGFIATDNLRRGRQGCQHCRIWARHGNFTARGQFANQIGGRLENPGMRQVLEGFDKFVARQNVVGRQGLFEPALDNHLKQAATTSKIRLITRHAIARGQIANPHQTRAVKHFRFKGKGLSNGTGTRAMVWNLQLRRDGSIDTEQEGTIGPRRRWR